MNFKFQISNFKFHSLVIPVKTGIQLAKRAWIPGSRPGMTTIFLIVTLYFALLTFNLSRASASGISLGIYPPIIKIQADPPASVEAPITIQNFGSETLDLQILLKPFTSNETENGEIKYTNEPPPPIFEKVEVIDGGTPLPSCHPREGGDPINKKNVDPWFAARDDTPCLTLSPKQQKKLIFKINVDKKEPDADYYFSIVFLSDTGNVDSRLRGNDKESATPDDSLAKRGFGGYGTNTNNSRTPGGIATNVLLTIGKGETKGIIEEFSAPLLLEKGPVPFTLRVKNTGKNVFAPIGYILIKNIFGQTVGKVDLLPVNILAGTVRAVPNTSPSPQPSPARGEGVISSPSTGAASGKQVLLGGEDKGEGDLQAVQAVWKENFLLGPYNATLTLALSEKGPIYKRSVQFIGTPTQAVIGLIIAILITLLIVAKVRRRLG